MRKIRTLILGAIAAVALCSGCFLKAGSSEAPAELHVTVGETKEIMLDVSVEGGPVEFFDITTTDDAVMNQVDKKNATVTRGSELLMVTLFNTSETHLEEVEEKTIKKVGKYEVTEIKDLDETVGLNKVIVQKKGGHSLERNYRLPMVISNISMANAEEVVQKMDINTAKE